MVRACVEPSHEPLTEHPRMREWRGTTAPMKKIKGLALHRDTVRVLTATDLAVPRGGFFVTTILKTVCLGCTDSCTADLSTT